MKSKYTITILLMLLAFSLLWIVALYPNNKIEIKENCNIETLYKDNKHGIYRFEDETGHIFMLYDGWEGEK